MPFESLALLGAKSVGILRQHLLPALNSACVEPHKKQKEFLLATYFTHLCLGPSGTANKNFFQKVLRAPQCAAWECSCRSREHAKPRGQTEGTQGQAAMRDGPAEQPRPGLSSARLQMGGGLIPALPAWWRRSWWRS